LIIEGDNMKRKTFNEKLNDSKDMPKIVIITDKKVIERYGGKEMLIAPPIEYSNLMSKVPEGMLITTNEIRKYLADKYDADFTCPMTAGIFINLAAQASAEREDNKIPFWRTLKSDGQLNPKYPHAINYQKKMLESEGHNIITKGRKNIQYYVEDFEDKIYNL